MKYVLCKNGMKYSYRYLLDKAERNCCFDKANRECLDQIPSQIRQVRYISISNKILCGRKY